MKIVAIIQARTGSTRLPEKVLALIDSFSLIEWVVERTKRAKLVDKVVVATTEDKADDILKDYLELRGISWFRGSQEDVLSRFYHCAIEHDADIIVRVTADDPFKAPELIDLAISKLLSDSTVDYCSNTLKATYPEGLDIEVFRFPALEQAFKMAISAADREHVTSFIWNKTENFNCLNFKYKEDLSQWRWTIDKPEDMDFIRAVVSRFNLNFDFDYEEIINALNNNKDLIEINANRTVRNEGYLKSIGQLD